MAVNNMAVSVETSGISIAELRSRFQQKEEAIIPKNSPNLRNGYAKPTPSPSSTLSTINPIKCESVAISNEDIAAVKLRLQKVLKPKPAIPPKNIKNDEQPSQTSRQINEESTVNEDTAVVPKVSVKPNRSHLSTLIADVQQKFCSPTPSMQELNTNQKDVEEVPPPLPPWPTAIKQLKDPVRLRSLPSLSETGAPPLVPRRPPHVRLKTFSYPTPPLPQRNSEKPLASLILVNESFPKVSSSPIPEYTEEQELGGRETPDELYGDAEVPITPSVISNNSSHSSNYPYGTTADDLYQDAYNPNCYSEEVYEDVSNVPATPSKDKRKSLIELERERKKQQKENEKKQREIKKSRERFGLTGEEVEVEVGIVKEDTRTKRKDDLPAKAGERIYILKISGTPTGKWLVKNGEGRVGYMDLNNIEVNADSVRSVMHQNKITPSTITDERSSGLYDDGHSEAIYEEIYLKKFSTFKS